MGWLGLLVPEARGGAGLGLTEACALAEVLAEGLVPEPLIQCAVVAPSLPDDVLHRVLAGDCIVLPAWQRRADTIVPGEDSTVSDGRVSGRKLFIPMAAAADLFLVWAGPKLVLLEAGAPGVTLETVQTQDGGHFGTLTMESAPCRPLEGTLAEPIETGILLTAAGLLGIMERAFALTLDYLRTRKQFGRPIGSFQALQHRAVDLKVQIALTRASVESAAALLDREADPARRGAAVSRAKARAANAAILVAQEGHPDARRHRLHRRVRRRSLLAPRDGACQPVRLRPAAPHPLRCPRAGDVR